jgi:hypothetical protein
MLIAFIESTLKNDGSASGAKIKKPAAVYMV